MCNRKNLSNIKFSVSPPYKLILGFITIGFSASSKWLMFPLNLESKRGYDGLDNNKLDFIYRSTNCICLYHFSAPKRKRLILMDNTETVYHKQNKK